MRLRDPHFWRDLNARTVLVATTLLAIFSFFAVVGLPEPFRWFGLLFAFVGWIPAIFVHDGWRVWVFAVAPVSVRTMPALIHIGYAGYSGDVGGYVVATPRSAAAATRWNRVMVSAGGPLASIAFAAWLVWWAIAGPAPGPLRPILFGLGGLSLAAAVGSGWPAWFAKSAGQRWGAHPALPARAAAQHTRGCHGCGAHAVGFRHSAPPLG